MNIVNMIFNEYDEKFKDNEYSQEYRQVEILLNLIEEKLSKEED